MPSTEERLDAATLAQAPSAALLAGWRSLERGFDRAFGASANPLRRLGALAILALWLLAVSGVWLYAVLDTSVQGAYASLAESSRRPWSPGGLMRSLHRYATDAFVVLIALHVMRELVHGRWRHFRRYSWWTGCTLLPFAAVAAGGGFWLSWDALAAFSATATAEWLDALPLLAQPLARNFLHDAAVNDRLFSLLVFVHLGTSLLLVFGLWFHLQRLTRAATFPPRTLALGTLATLLVLAGVQPVVSQAPAALGEVPRLLAFDWLLLSVHPLMYATSGAFVWLLGGAAFLALLMLPCLPGPPRAAAAVVDPQNCNGCRRCFADCPYAAITMTRHPAAGHARELAVVDADLCAGCGLCAGACPSATPFRGARILRSGIDLPDCSVDALRRDLRQGLAAFGATRPIVVFACRRGAATAGLASADVLLLPLSCGGQLPPSFVEYAQRDGAAGVLIVSCEDGGCEYRLGAQWTAARFAGTREPRLRSLMREPTMLVQADRGEEQRLHAALAAMRAAASRRARRAAAPSECGHG